MDPKYKELLDRIVDGAEYIEKIGTEHAHYKAAMKKYDRLCEELKELQSWTI